MPVLPKEVDLYPENLLANEGSSDKGERAWRVFHTPPRQEKTLARKLLDRKIPFYLPLVPRQLRIRGRPVTSFVPLFAGYVFLHTDPHERLAAMNTHRVLRSLEVTDQERLWQDLRQIHRLITSGAAITPEGQLKPGAIVEICSGPLAGLQGTIVRAASGQRFVVKVDFIQQGASVELDGSTLTKILESTIQK